MSQHSTLQAPPPEPIAVVGSGCRFPGESNTPSKLWSLLHDPRDLRTPIPPERFSSDGFYHADGTYHGHSNVQHAHFLSGDVPNFHRRFDARFFGINPSEARVMDPQMRLLLETVYEALESGGHTIESLAGSDTAVYAGTMLGEYEYMMGRDLDSIGSYNATGTSRALVSNRVSYFFDWHGPSMTIDTACSSSLMAVHQAAQQLRAGRSRVAVAAGANLILDPVSFVSMSKLKMLSPDGRSRMWDAGVNGYARGEGVAAVVLKTLSQAERDGDVIECVIREIGANQDGRTPGLTMPSASAQANLIRECYTRAGLDPTQPGQRPQFFEAHGTGTPAGDPVEAEAIATAFFPHCDGDDDDGHGAGLADNKLYVGSIKTVIGHTEGTAGLAALLKASLALQNGIIPPNMHFNRLNPKIERFYSNLKVPTEPVAWPATAAGSDDTRRASINSFGFGGANCHAILENYTPPPRQLQVQVQEAAPFAPFVFSAVSRSSLALYLRQFRDYLQQPHPKPSPADLAHTLHSRRSCLPYSLTVSASTLQELSGKLEARLKMAAGQADDEFAVKPILLQDSSSSSESAAGAKTRLRILGVFTGQGAQWARMGAELLESSRRCRSIVEQLDHRLAQLPAEHRPSWSLVEELCKPAASSRIGEAVFSQPLSTALQILLVDTLRAAGVSFDAVVGHSSGEIGAAYAAGVISAGDAICIAYYRGFFSHLAVGAKGDAGAMMAVESTLDDMNNICGSRRFRGKVVVAAVNSPSSLTVSGNQERIEALQVILQDEAKFARLLKVDKAYHSHHMLACSDKYLAALAALDIRVQNSSRCTWFSSVCDGEKVDGQLLDAVKGRYWNENMTKPVLFMQAIQSAWNSAGPFDLAVEVGPHPALKSPALQSTLAVTEVGSPFPYTGMLQRGMPALATVADGLGFVWSRLEKGHVDLAAYEGFMSGRGSSPKTVTGLPSYAWDHETEYWHESRYTKAQLSRLDPVHPLLGHITPDSNEQITRWRNLLRPKEIRWLKGHQLQGQIVFPAAGYVALALEATMIKAASIQGRRRKGATTSPHLDIVLLEVLDLEIEKALAFDQDDSSIEAVFTLGHVVWSAPGKDGKFIMTADFIYNAAAERDLQVSLLARGRVRVVFGRDKYQVLPAREMRASNLLKVPADDFYESLEKIGYDYSGPFRALTSIERCLGYATGIIDSRLTDDDNDDNDDDNEAAGMASEGGLLVHPAMLDAAFQAIFAAQSVPYDGGIWSLHVPRRIRGIRVSPSALWGDNNPRPAPPVVSFNATLAAKEGSEKGIGGDVALYLVQEQQQQHQHAAVQVEGLLCVPFAPSTAEGDRKIFSTTVWDVAIPNAGYVGSREFKSSPEQRQLAHLLERLSVFYLRRLDQAVPASHPARSTGSFPQLFKYARYWTSQADAETQLYWKREWASDTAETIERASEPYAHTVDVRLLRAMGEEYVAVATGQKQAIEIGMRDNLLSEFYQQSVGMGLYSAFLARIVKQIVHRHPHSHFLEIGAGTGGVTKYIFDEIGSSYATYTFTDVSSGFMSAAETVLVKQREQHGMMFKVLDINKPAATQGFQDQSYDVIVASMVLHATDNLETTLRHVRRLLRPGGYLVLLEILPSCARIGATFGTFPGWWAGSENSDSNLSPLANVDRWDVLLRRAGFAGCDTVTQTPEPVVAPFAVIVAQAVDERVSILRSPLLASDARQKMIDDLVIVIGSQPASQLATQIANLVQPFCRGRVTTARSWGEIGPDTVSDKTTVLALSDLSDGACFFQQASSELGPAWDNLVGTLPRMRTLLWVTQSRREKNPHANMMVGLLRSASVEIPTLDAQCLDFSHRQVIQPQVVAETLLRFRAATTWQRDGTSAGLSSGMVLAEPEIQLDDNGWPMVPRLVPSRQMNDRYNTARRDVSEVIRLGQGRRDESVEVVRVDRNSRDIKGHSLCRGRLPTQLLQRQSSDGARVMQTSHSILQALRVADSSHLYLALGKDMDTGDQAIFLSKELASHAVPASEDLSILTEIDNGLESEFLEHVAHHLVASAILKGLGKGDRILALEPSPDLAAILTWRAKNLGARATFITCKSEAVVARRLGLGANWLRVHPMATMRQAQKLVPHGVTVFIDLSSQPPGADAMVNPRKLADDIRAAIPAHCRLESRHTLFGTGSGQGKNWWASRIVDARSRLQDAVNHALYSLAGRDGGDEAAWSVHNIPISVLASSSPGPTQFDDHVVSVVDWTGAPEVTVDVQPVDGEVTLDPTKTYWLAGLSHGLGLSLCQWMVRRGARFVAISSRHPDIDEAWLAGLSRETGAVVRVLQCDLTSEASVRYAHNELCGSMPPIAGVAQGAMVLDDVLIADMSLEQMLKVARPKVEGSVYLDRLFRDPRGPLLDFFIFFSSSSSVVGWQGQGNYAAANLFMGALAEQRRRSGLAASVINIGPVLGVGYITQNARTDLRRRADAHDTWFISETDFLQLFAEAIVAGRPRSGRPQEIEITTGVEQIPLQGGGGVLPSWARNPVFSHCLAWNDEEAAAAAGNSSGGGSVQVVVPLKTRLAQSTTRNDVFTVVHNALLPKLASLYQRPADELAREDPAALQLAEMGTDSLLATEIRTWFIKTLQVDIPVLKILGGASVKELCIIAAEALPAAWIPKVEAGDVHVSGAAWVPPLQPTPTPAPQANILPAEESELKENPVGKPAASLPTVVEDSGAGPLRPPAVASLHVKAPDSSPSRSTSVPGFQTPSQILGTTNSSASSVSSEVSSAPADEDLPLPAKKHNQQHFEKVVPLSFNQATFWFVRSLLKDTSCLSNTVSFKLTGRIRQSDLERALQIIVQRHEILRACFIENEEGQPMQGFLAKSSMRGEYRTIRSEQEAVAAIEQLQNHVFDLTRGDNLRAVLLTLTPAEHFLVLTSHALVADGMSTQIFLRELQQLFANTLPAPPTQYAAYAIKQHDDYQAGRFVDELRFWRAEYPVDDFPEPLPILRLGRVSARPPLTNYENERAEMRIGTEIKAQIKSLCRRAGITPFHFHLTVFRALLATSAESQGVQDVSIGIADAHRTDDEFLGTYGPFVNLLPLRFQEGGGRQPTFEDRLKETRIKVLSALRYSAVPFQVLLTELGAPRSASHPPIFQCLVDYRVGQRPDISLSADIKLELLSYALEKVAYDLALDVIDDPDDQGDCTFTLIVRQDMYSRQDAETLLASYKRLVQAFVENPKLRLDEPNIYDPVEVDRALRFAIGPERSMTWPETLVHRVDDIIRERGNDVAVTWNSTQLTYSQLGTRVNEIALALSQSGVRASSRVGVLQEATGDWIACILAIMRLGAIYLPLDQGNPWNRLAAITKDCGPGLILVDNDTEQHVCKLSVVPGLKTINVARIVSQRQLIISSSNAATADKAATILYTSGSTGTPKGIVLKHEGLRNWLDSTTQVYDLRHDEVVLQQSAPGFDMSMIQIFTALCLGGTLCLVPRALRGDAAAITDIIHTQGVTYSMSCASETSAWFKFGDLHALAKSRWRRAVIAGEPGVRALLGDFASLQMPELRIFHSYGPTETTFTATSIELPYRDGVPTNTNMAVGYPIPNYTVYILDEQLRPVPAGVQGEVYIGGPGVALGYLNNDALNQERFVPNTVADPKQQSQRWGTLHRAGDLGRWGKQGELFLEGRMTGDTQVKLRGLRIDLAEVERALIDASRGMLAAVAVSLRRSAVEDTIETRPFLVAHVVLDQAYTADQDALNGLTADLGLPRYMIPTAIIAIAKMPLTTSSKLDRRAIAQLPLPESDQFDLPRMREIDMDASETETELRRVWQDVISEKIGRVNQTVITPETDFFHVGGTSLLLLELRRRIHTTWDVELGLVDMFDASTLAGMALSIGQRKGKISAKARTRHQPGTAGAEIDWDHQTALPASLLQLSKDETVETQSKAVVPSAHDAKLTIVLTGATGYLGNALLQFLIQDPRIERVHCLAVRNPERFLSAKTEEARARVVVHQGDLILPRLGLSAAAERAILDTAHVVIHNGADVSYLKTYSSLKAPNVEATKTLAEMCLSRRIPFHYISSTGSCAFAGAAGQASCGPQSVAGFPPPSAAGSVPGYFSSKWASEVFLEKVKQQCPDWRVWVHRPSNIERINDEDGTPGLDLVQNIRHYARELSAVPIVAQRKGKDVGSLNSVTLEAVVKGVLNTVLLPVGDGTDNAGQDQGDEPKFVHHLGDQELPMGDVKEWFEMNGKEVVELDLRTWSDLAVERGMHPTVAAFVRSFGWGIEAGGVVFPCMVA